MKKNKIKIKKQLPLKIKKEIKDGVIEGVKIDIKKRWFKSKIFIFNIVSFLLALIVMAGPEILNMLMLNDEFTSFFKENYQRFYIFLIFLNTAVNIYLRTKNQNTIVFKKENETNERDDKNEKDNI